MKNSLPLISIYIVSKNYGKYVSKAINSILKQTYKNWELYLVNDNSADNTLKIFKKFKSKNKKILKVLNYNKNTGLQKISNDILKICNGQYILRLDADDYLHPKAIETMFKMIKNSLNTALIFPNFYTFNNSSKKMKFNRYENKKNYNIDDKPAHGACCLINKKIFNKIGGYNTKFDRQDGYYLWLILLLNKYQISHCKKPLFFYRKHNKSLSKNLIKILTVRLDIINFFSKKNLYFKNLLMSNKKKTNFELKKFK